MAIVKMKRLHILALESDRNILFDQLQRLGCVEVSEQTDKLSDPDWTALVHPDESDLTQQQARLEQSCGCTEHPGSVCSCQNKIAGAFASI